MRLEDVYDRPKPVIIDGVKLLELAGQQRAGMLTIASMSRTKRNGFWAVIIQFHASDTNRRGPERGIDEG